MALFVRMALYFLFGSLAGQGWLHFDQVTGIVTIDVNHLGPLLVGLGGTVATFAWSRIAKARGGKT